MKTILSAMMVAILAVSVLALAGGHDYAHAQENSVENQVSLSNAPTPPNAPNILVTINGLNVTRTINFQTGGVSDLNDPFDELKIFIADNTVVTFEYLGHPATNQSVVPGRVGLGGGYELLSSPELTVRSLMPGPASIFYVVVDTDGDFGTGQFTIIVTEEASPDAEPPTANDIIITLTAGEEFDLDINSTHASDDLTAFENLTFSVDFGDTAFTAPQSSSDAIHSVAHNGTLTLVYPEPIFVVLQENFTYTVQDEQGKMTNGTVVATINPRLPVLVANPLTLDFPYGMDSYTFTSPQIISLYVLTPDYYGPVLSLDHTTATLSSGGSVTIDTATVTSETVFTYTTPDSALDGQSYSGDNTYFLTGSLTVAPHDEVTAEAEILLRVAAPQCVVTPGADIDFGDLMIGEESSEALLVLENTGDLESVVAFRAQTDWTDSADSGVVVMEAEQTRFSLNLNVNYDDKIPLSMESLGLGTLAPTADTTAYIQLMADLVAGQEAFTGIATQQVTITSTCG